MRRCRGPHPILLVRDWTTLGLDCRCTYCDAELFATKTDLADYIGFVHTSSEGPDSDITLLIHKERAR